MQITIKQPEIISALRLFIEQQGINLAGKDLSIKFTAGRGDAGLSADISIEPMAMPDFGGADGVAVVAEAAPAVAATKAKAIKPALVAVAAPATEVVEQPAAEVKGAVAGNGDDPSVGQETAVAGNGEPEVAVAKTSLFA